MAVLWLCLAARAQESGLDWGRQSAMTILTGLVGTLFGVLLTWLLGGGAEQRRRRYETTNTIASTFFAPDFLRHRVGMWRIGEAVTTNETTMADVACGFWYPGKGAYYEGAECYGLTLHEHLTIYLDWLTGVGYAIRTGLADRTGPRA